MNLRDAIHFRAPQRWRGKVKSRKVRDWFRQSAQWPGALAPADPGPGPLELSVRIPRRELKQAAQRLGISGTVLLRRLIAAQLEPQQGLKAGSMELRVPKLSIPVINQASSIPSANVLLRKPAGVLPASKPTQTFSPSQNAPKPQFVAPAGEVRGVRSLEQIGQAMREGVPITGEELRRWQLAFPQR